MSDSKDERWAELYEKYSASILNPSNTYLQPAEENEKPTETD